MLIVLDTNVLVSGLLNRQGIPGRILNLVVEGPIRLAVDRPILEEYNEVTQRVSLKIDPTDRAVILSAIRAMSLWTNAAPLDISLSDVPDPDDLPFAEVAVAAQASFLVTGNKKHFGFLKLFDVQVVSPAEFVEQFPREETKK